MSDRLTQPRSSSTPALGGALPAERVVRGSLEPTEPGGGVTVEQRVATDEELNALLGTDALITRTMKATAPRQEHSGPHAMTVGPYRLWRVLGEGGMGTVYEAELEERKERVALKVLRGGGVSSPAWSRFQREAEFLAQLDHPNIAKVLETGLHQDARGIATPWIAMELVNGRGIRQHAEEEQLDHRERIGLLLQACAAVSHAHAKGIVHRDLKPDNILVDRTTGRVRVLDFGVARAMDEPELESTQLTMVGDIVGTLSYMSPEQACGRPEEIDARSDVYALGVVAFELLSGRLPIDLEGLPLADALGRIRDYEADRLVASDTGVRRDLDVIVGKALEREPSRRYASVDELAADLRRYLSHEPIVARPPSATERFVRFARRNRPLVLAVAGVMLTLAVAVVATTKLAWSEAEARGFADATAERALLREQDALRAVYRAELAAARAAIDQGNMGTARRRLEAAPLPLRGWEWNQLGSSLDESLAHWTAPEGEPVSLAFGPRGKTVVAASELGVSVAAVPSGETIWSWQAAPGERVVRLSTDGQRALLLHDKVARLLFIGSGETRILDASSTTHLDFLPCGELVHLNSLDEQGRWSMVFADVTTGEERWRVRVSRDPGGVLVVGGSIVRASLEDGGAELLDPLTGSTRHLPGPWVTGLRMARSGEYVLGTQAWTGRTIAWDSRSWALAPWQDNGPNQAGIDEIAFDDEGRIIVSTHSDGITQLREGRSGRLIAKLARCDLAGLAPKPVLHVDSGRLAVADAHHAILIASSETGEPLHRLQGHARWLRALSFHPDGSLLASLDGDGQVRLWTLADMSDPRVLRGHESYVYDVEISPDGTRVASAAWDGTTRLWDLASGAAIATLRDPADAPLFGKVAWSPNGDWLVSVHGHSVTLWDARTSEVLGTQRLKRWEIHHSSVTEPIGATWLPDGSGFLIGSVWRAVHYYAVNERGEIADEIEWPMQGEALDVSPDGRLLAASVHDVIELWDLTTMELVIRHGEPHARSRDLAFSPDGKRLAAVSDDSFLRVWSVEDGFRLLKVNAHGDQAHGLTWSPDGSRIATGGSDRVVRIWDAERGEELAALRGHGSYSYTLDWSDDGHVLVSGSGDGTVRIWDESPLTQRQSARHERARLRPELLSQVSALLVETPDVRAAVDRIARRERWSSERRRIASDLLLEIAASQ